MSGLCAEHAREHSTWLAPSPETWRALAGNSGISIVQIGRPTVASMRAEEERRYERARAGLRAQLQLIVDACAIGTHCAPDPR